MRSYIQKVPALAIEATQLTMPKKRKLFVEVYGLLYILVLIYFAYLYCNIFTLKKGAKRYIEKQGIIEI